MPRGQEESTTGVRTRTDRTNRNGDGVLEPRTETCSSAVLLNRDPRVFFWEHPRQARASVPRRCAVQKNHLVSSPLRKSSRPVERFVQFGPLLRPFRSSNSFSPARAAFPKRGGNSRHGRRTTIEHLLHDAHHVAAEYLFDRLFAVAAGEQAIDDARQVGDLIHPGGKQPAHPIEVAPNT